MSGEHAEVPVAARVRRLEERLIAAGLITDAELDEILERVFATGLAGERRADGRPAPGTTRPTGTGCSPTATRRRPSSASAPGSQGYLLKVVENTPSVHNVIVCTLCSCYPTALLGPSPSWYKSFAYRSRVVREPRAVLAEFGLELPDSTEIRVWDANSETRYLVLPLRPEAAAEMDESALASLVTRNGLIGTAVR